MFLLDSNTCQEMSANICLVDYLSFMTDSKSQEKRVKRVLLAGVLEVLLKDNVSTNYVADCRKGFSLYPFTCRQSFDIAFKLQFTLRISINCGR